MTYIDLANYYKGELAKGGHTQVSNLPENFLLTVILDKIWVCVDKRINRREEEIRERT